jgi:cation transport regulator ChaC
VIEDDNKDDLWVFGYGSLIWQPGFEFEDSALAWVYGYHRALCISRMSIAARRSNQVLCWG